MLQIPPLSHPRSAPSTGSMFYVVLAAAAVILGAMAFIGMLAFAISFWISMEKI